MNKQIAAIMDKVISKGMAIMESEKAQKLLESPQAQKAMELGLNALTRIQELREAAKAQFAASLGLATQKDLDSLRESLEKVEEKVCDAPAACDCQDCENEEANEEA
ncbi:MAG: hypothetical protein IIY06_09380 [Proteobacteria bacterium]|jgi:hypothetical protein|nr:hypothetical protein [Pseudomonadota bacterium]